MSEKQLTEVEVHERAKSIDNEIKTVMYDDATNIGGVANIGIAEFVKKEAEYFTDYTNEPEPVLRQAATNAAKDAVEMMAKEGKFMD